MRYSIGVRLGAAWRSFRDPVPPAPKPVKPLVIPVRIDTTEALEKLGGLREHLVDATTAARELADTIARLASRATNPESADGSGA